MRAIVVRDDLPFGMIRSGAFGSRRDDGPHNAAEEVSVSLRAASARQRLDGDIRHTL